MILNILHKKYVLGIIWYGLNNVKLKFWISIFKSIAHTRIRRCPSKIPIGVSNIFFFVQRKSRYNLIFKILRLQRELGKQSKFSKKVKFEFKMIYRGAGEWLMSRHARGARVYASRSCYFFIFSSGRRQAPLRSNCSRVT